LQGQINWFGIALVLAAAWSFTTIGLVKAPEWAKFCFSGLLFFIASFAIALKYKIEGDR